MSASLLGCERLVAHMRAAAIFVVKERVTTERATVARKRTGNTIGCPIVYLDELVGMNLLG